jgi:hypothetical protein
MIMKTAEQSLREWEDKQLALDGIEPMTDEDWEEAKQDLQVRSIIDVMETFANQSRWIRAVANPEDEDLDIEGLKQGTWVDIWTPNHGRQTDVEYNGGVSFYDHESDTEYICCEDEVWYMPIPGKPLPPTE